MVSYTPSYVLKFLPHILNALPLTLWIIVLTVLFGSFLGLGLAWAQLGQDSFLIKAARGYVFILRCTPPIVLLFMVFYGLPEFFSWWLGLDLDHWSRTIFVVVTMVLLFAASISEVFKAAYLAVPKGQTEAALSIGLTDVQSFYRIVMPQAFKIALPNMTTAILNLMKDTALAYTIGLVDVMGAGNLLIGKNLGNYSLETYTAVAVIYWGIAIALSLVSYVLEGYLDRGRS